MSPEALKIELPKLPELDKESLAAIRASVPGRVLGRTAALLSLLVLVLTFSIAVKLGLKQLLNFEPGLPTWLFYPLLVGVPLGVVVVQLVIEWRAEQHRRKLKQLAVQPGPKQSDYFRIGPYEDTAEDRSKFRRPDHAEDKTYSLITQSSQLPLYTIGDSGSGKTSMLRASVLPRLREQGWTVVEARAWQDPLNALRSAILKRVGSRRSTGLEGLDLSELIRDTIKRSDGPFLAVLDQFEEFVILAEKSKQEEFILFLDGLKQHPIKNFNILLVLRSDYEDQLEEIGLPRPRSGENLCRVSRFQTSAAADFLRESGLNLQEQAIEKLLASASELDETLGKVRPITLNVIGYVLASGTATAPSMEAGELVRRYIAEAVEQPLIQDRAPLILEHMITEIGTKRPRSEQQLVSATDLKIGEVRGVLNALREAELVRPLEPELSIWEFSHDFLARSAGRYLGRRKRLLLRRAVSYSAPALLAAGLLIGAGFIGWKHYREAELRAELNDRGIAVNRNVGGLSAEKTSAFQVENMSEIVDLLSRLGRVTSIDLSHTGISDLGSLQSLVGLERIDLASTRISSLEQLKPFVALETLDASDTRVTSLAPLQGMTRLSVLTISKSPITDFDALRHMKSLRILEASSTNTSTLDPLREVNALETLDVSNTGVTDLAPLSKLPSLKVLSLSNTHVTDLAPLSTISSLVALDISTNAVRALEALQNLGSLQTLTVSSTQVTDLAPLRNLKKLQGLYLASTPVRNISALSGLTALQTLYLTNTPLTDLTPIHTLVGLQGLYLASSRNISDLSALSGLTGLQRLDISGTSAAALKPIERLTSLESLVIDDMTAREIDEVRDLPRLKSLDIRSKTNLVKTEFYDYRRTKGLDVE